MKTLFDAETLSEMQNRLASLRPDSSRVWGKMTPSQAMEHTARVLEMATSPEQPVEQVLLGKMLSWIFKGSFVGEKPFGRNAPTGPDYIIKDDPSFDATRERLLGMIKIFHERGAAGLDGNVHPFFGRLTGEQWGVTQYKHVDHHLRQFGV